MKDKKITTESIKNYHRNVGKRKNFSLNGEVILEKY